MRSCVFAVCLLFYSCTSKDNEGEPGQVPEALLDSFRSELNEMSSFASPDGETNKLPVGVLVDAVSGNSPDSSFSSIFEEDGKWAYRYVKYEADREGEDREGVAFFTELCGKDNVAGEGVGVLDVRLTECGPREMACPDTVEYCSCANVQGAPVCSSKKTDTFVRYQTVGGDEIIREDGATYSLGDIHGELKGLIDDRGGVVLFAVPLSPYLHSTDFQGRRVRREMFGRVDTDTKYIKTGDGTIYGINFSYPLFANPVFKMNADRTEYYYLNPLYRDDLSPEYHKEGWDRQFRPHELVGIRTHHLTNLCILGRASSCEALSFGVQQTLCYERSVREACDLLPRESLEQACEIRGVISACHSLLREDCRSGRRQEACRLAEGHGVLSAHSGALPLGDVEELCGEENIEASCTSLPGNSLVDICRTEIMKETVERVFGGESVAKDACNALCSPPHRETLSASQVSYYCPNPWIRNPPWNRNPGSAEDSSAGGGDEGFLARIFRAVRSVFRR